MLELQENGKRKQSLEEYGGDPFSFLGNKTLIYSMQKSWNLQCNVICTNEQNKVSSVIIFIRR